MNLPMLSNELYRSARWLRIFVARPVTVDKRRVLRLAHLPEAQVRSRVAGAEPLLRD